MTPAPDLHALGDELLDGTAPLDLEGLVAAGYPLLAVPVEFGGLGGNLAQVCQQQRRLAGRAPQLARHLTIHLAWTGAAAEARAAGNAGLVWLLEAAAAGEVFTEPPGPAEPTGARRWIDQLLAAQGGGGDTSINHPRTIEQAARGRIPGQRGQSS